MKRIICFSLVVFVSISAYCQDISGVWAGSLNLIGSSIDIYYSISKNESNEYIGSYSVPSQGVRNIPLDTLSFDGISVVFKSNAFGGTRFTGTFITTGFLGEFFQKGTTIPLSLVPGEIPIPKRPQEPKPPYPYSVENVVFHNSVSDIDLAGTITIPEGNGPFVGVVLVSGSGYQDRNEEIYDHKPFWVIADYLARHGVVVLRYDDRGVGESGGSKIDNTTKILSYDAAAAISYLKSRPEVKTAGICGHSEGGTIAFMLAAENPQIGFVISLAGTSVRGDEILLAQQSAIAKASNLSKEYISLVREANREVYDIVIASDSVDNTLKEQLRAFYTSNPMTANLKGKLLDQQISVMTDPWLYFFIKYSPQDDLSKIKVPILALDGTKDLQVPADLNLPAILKATSGNPNVTVKYLNGLNHLFQHAGSGSPDEYPTIEETFSPEALQIMADWLVQFK